MSAPCSIGRIQRLQVDRPGVFLNSAFDLAQVVGIHEGGLHAVLGQRVLQQVEASAVDRLLGHDVAAVRRQGFDRVGDGRRAGGHRQGRASAFQGGDAFLKHVLGAVRQPAVDVSGIRQAEPVGGVLAVMENVGSGLVDRYRPGVRCGIRLFLSDVKLQCFEFIVTHFSFPLLSFLFLYDSCLFDSLFSSPPGIKKPGSFSCSRAKWLCNKLIA